MKKLLSLMLVVVLMSTVAFGATLKLEWKFENNALDTSGQGINGSYFGTSAFTDGIVDRAFVSSGSNSIYKTGISSSLLPIAAADAWSVNIWVKPDDTPSDWNVLFAIGNKPSGNATNSSRAVYSNATGDIVFTDGTGLGGHFLVGTAKYEVDAWQMITATYDGTNVTLYKNGQNIGSLAFTFTTAPGEVRVPTNPGWSTFMSGAFDEFTIWSGCLTGSEVSAMYKAIVPEPATMTILALGGLLLRRRK
ncbi:MAG: LamG domain-containing protein [Planctomycetaceae bacterium]|nr:LamG domain-containing protein [Planctomycetaceae bacterium]